MLNIIERARVYTENRVKKKVERKIIKEQRYKDFIANPPRPLPPLETLVLWRNIFICITFTMICISCIILFMYYDLAVSTDEDILKTFDNIYIIPFFGSMITSGLGVVLDYCIGKRFGNRYTIIQWKH